MNDRTREMVEQLCAGLDRAGLNEVMQIAKSAYDARVRRELDGWRPGQRVEVATGDGRLSGTVVSVNRMSLTIDVGGKRVRVQPSSARHVGG